MSTSGPDPEALAVLLARTGRLDRHAYKLAEEGRYGLDAAFADGDDLIDEGHMALTIPFADGRRRDGVGDLLEVGGIRTERHRDNPIILFDHGKQVKLPVALAEDPQTKEYTVRIDPVGQRATALAFFYQGRGEHADAEHALFCEQLFDLIARRYVRAGSIGYQVLAAKSLPADPRAGTPAGLHLLSVLMLEASAVVLPANQDTVRKALCLPSLCGKPLSHLLVKSLEPYAPPPVAQLGFEARPAKDDPIQTKGAPSYFGDCERDETGHCLPEGQSGAPRPAPRPAPGRPAPKPTGFKPVGEGAGEAPTAGAQFAQPGATVIARKVIVHRPPQGAPQLVAKAGDRLVVVEVVEGGFLKVRAASGREAVVPQTDVQPQRAPAASDRAAAARRKYAKQPAKADPKTPADPKAQADSKTPMKGEGDRGDEKKSPAAKEGGSENGEDAEGDKKPKQGTKAMPMNPPPAAPGAGAGAPPAAGATPPGPDLNQDGVVTPEEIEVYSAQVVRRMHEDASYLLADYDQMAGYLEHEPTKQVIVQKLQDVVAELEMLESHFGQHYPDLAQRKPLGGMPPMNPQQQPPADPNQAPPAEGQPPAEGEAPPAEGQTPPPDADPADAESQGDEDTMTDDGRNSPADEALEEPSAEDAAAGMKKKVKALEARAKYAKCHCGKPNCDCKGNWKPGGGRWVKDESPGGAAREVPAEGKSDDKAEEESEEGEDAEAKMVGGDAGPEQVSSTAGGGGQDAPEPEPEAMAAGDPAGAVGFKEHERGWLSDACGFLREVSSAKMLDDEGRMKSYHFHKILESIGMLGNVAGGGEGDGKGLGEEVYRKAMGHGRAIKAASYFLKALALSRDFGDPHRHQALSHHVALSDVMKALPALPMIAAAVGAAAAAGGGGEAGEKGEKELMLAFARQRESLEALERSLARLAG